MVRTVDRVASSGVRGELVAVGKAIGRGLAQVESSPESEAALRAKCSFLLRVRLCPDVCVPHPKLFENSDQSGGAVSGIHGRASSKLVKLHGTVVHHRPLLTTMSHGQIFVSCAFTAHVFMVPEIFSIFG